MRKLFFFLLITIPSIVYCQLGVSFHQSNLSFIGINYEFKGRIRPELRFTVNNYIEDITVEGIGTYDLLKTEDYQFYGGLGIRVNSNNGGLVMPIGLNVYPLPYKQFGFHIEVAPIIEDEFGLRGSWGIRYRFKKRP